MIKIAVVASTNGGTLGKVMELPYIKERIATVISDRPCGAIDLARRHGIRTVTLPNEHAALFSDQLCDFLDERPHDLTVAFYTKLFSGRLLERHDGKLVNFHPSLLPACPGSAGFEDTLRSGATFIGATVHYIDAGMDTGAPILQAAIPYDPRWSHGEARHQVFVAQCKMFIQLVKWVEDDRIKYVKNQRPLVKRATYDIGSFSPNLDFHLSLDFNVSYEPG